MKEPREWKFVGVTARFEPPDVLIARSTGLTTLADLQYLDAIFRQLGREQRFFLITDLTHSTGTELDARQWGVREFDRTLFAGVVFFGGERRVRLVLESLFQGLQSLSHWSVPIAFLNTEDEARAWVAEHRPLATM